MSEIAELEARINQVESMLGSIQLSVDMGEVGFHGNMPVGPIDGDLVGDDDQSAPWKVTSSTDAEDPPVTTISVLDGLLALIGSDPAVDSNEDFELTEEQITDGVWIIKQFSNTSNAWIIGLQTVTTSELAADTTLIGDEIEEASEEGADELTGQWIAVDVAAADGSTGAHTHDATAAWNLFPDTIQRQRRVIAYIDTDGITQYAFGSIYAVGNGSEVADDVTEDGADQSDAECDQNVDPQDQDDGPAGTEDEEPSDPADTDTEGGGGSDDPADDGDDDSVHDPSDADCYSTIPTPLT